MTHTNDKTQNWHAQFSRRTWLLNLNSDAETAIAV